MLEFWGKAQPRTGPVPAHPLIFHMLDVAACAGAILGARPLALRRSAAFLNIPCEQARSTLTLAAALHDLGKFAAAFQAKAPECFPRAVFACDAADVGALSQHDVDGRALWDARLADEIGARIWTGDRETLDLLIAASCAHHGRPVAASRPGVELVQEVFRPEGAAAARAAAAALVTLILPGAIAPRGGEDRLSVRRASFWFSGLITTADWIGSNQDWFPYTAAADCSIDEYWVRAQRRATDAVRWAGLAVAASAPRRTPHAITQLPADTTLTPLQQHAEHTPLPSGPLLFLIEDVTGAGKTEAAQILTHRLMAQGRAAGAYWGMPTQATANAMYLRQEAMLAGLFAPGARPSLVLAHGQSRLLQNFSSAVLPKVGAPEETSGGEASDETASAACAAFLAEDKRAALLADMGAGTIDQALLSTLPARFHTVRLFGLADKVLVIDEAHAYDAYMGAEIEGLLRFQAALGGSAIVLSATLPRQDRERFVRAWREGLGFESRGRLTHRNDYPLVTVVSGAGVEEIAVDSAPQSRRRTPVRFVEHEDDVLGALEGAARMGAAAAWVRNSVDDAITAAAALRERGFDPILFHARFAQGDRQRIESEVMRIFGKNSEAQTRRGKIVIATQVIEQSLDLDFDVMASDLAPIDLIIQRAGRLRRHRARDATRPDVEADLIVLAPPFTDAPSPDWLSSFARVSEWIYKDPALLWRTRKALEGAREIVAPDAFRALIEAVYAEDAPTPEGLQGKSDRAAGDASAERSLGRSAIASLRAGYVGEGRECLPEERALTRLGERQTTLRLALIESDGRLRPYFAHADPRRAWALSEVRVFAHRAPWGAVPAPEFRDAAKHARESWGRREREREDLIVLPLECAGEDWTARLRASGVDLNFRYSRTSGLTF